MSKSAIGIRALVYLVVMTTAVVTGLSLSCTSKKPTEPSFAISATSGAHGAIVPSGATSVKRGGEQAFTMTADSGYQLVILRIDGISSSLSSTYTFSNVATNHYIYAGFSHVYSITSSAGLHGSISPQGNMSVNDGASLTFIFTPDAGYRVADVLVDGVSVGAVSSYTFVNISADHSVSVVFGLIPMVLSADSGLYYKGTMQGFVQTPTPIVRATDPVGFGVDSLWLQVTRIAGDGIPATDSLMTDSSGAIYPSYYFNATKGHAVIRCILPLFDTLDLFMRATTLIWGDSAQGQYVRIGDTYSFVKSFNGQPERIDIDPSAWLTYAVYESALGVVVMLNDIDQDEGASDFETVYGIILNSVYTGKFSNGIGIGSDSSALVTAFGVPDTTYFDSNPPPAWVYVYRTEGLTFFLNQAIPPKIIEIHLVAPAPAPLSLRRFGASNTSK